MMCVPWEYVESLYQEEEVRADIVTISYGGIK